MQCAATLRGSPTPSLLRRGPSRPGAAAAQTQQQQRRLVTAAAGQQRPGGGDGKAAAEDPGMVRAYTSQPAAVPEKDPWEGEQFEVIGTLASYAVPILALLAVGIGFFASATYEEGATVFLDNPKYDGDTVKLIPASELAALAPAAPSPN